MAALTQLEFNRKWRGTWRGTRYVKGVCSVRRVIDFDFGNRLHYREGRSFTDRSDVKSFEAWIQCVKAVRER